MCHVVYWFLENLNSIKTLSGRQQDTVQVLRSVAAMLAFSWSLVALLLVSSSWAEEEVAAIDEDTSRELSVGELLERANRDRTPDFDEPTLIGGDIAIKSEADRNADPCTSRGCLWGKWSDGKVYIPYYIANHYSSREQAIIIRGLESFSSVSCIRFRPYQSGDHEWLSIESRNGCYSYVGRQGGGQTVSLSRQGCLYHSTVQHELLHALGFNHEQTRSDRDSYIQVYWDNIIDGMEYNFYKIDTLNQGTPYDYNSVMQYERYAFSKNNRPTMVPIPNSNVVLGQATQMSKNDIDRLNRLYKCCKYCGSAGPKRNLQTLKKTQKQSPSKALLTIHSNQCLMGLYSATIVFNWL